MQQPQQDYLVAGDLVTVARKRLGTWYEHSTPEMLQLLSAITAPELDEPAWLVSGMRLVYASDVRLVKLGVTIPVGARFYHLQDGQRIGEPYTVGSIGASGVMATTGDYFAYTDVRGNSLIELLDDGGQSESTGVE